MYLEARYEKIDLDQALHHATVLTGLARHDVLPLGLILLLAISLVHVRAVFLVIQLALLAWPSIQSLHHIQAQDEDPTRNGGHQDPPLPATRHATTTRILDWWICTGGSAVFADLIASQVPIGSSRHVRTLLDVAGQMILLVRSGQLELSIEMIDWGRLYNVEVSVQVPGDEGAAPALESLSNLHDDIAQDPSNKVLRSALPREVMPSAEQEIFDLVVADTREPSPTFSEISLKSAWSPPGLDDRVDTPRRESVGSHRIGQSVPTQNVQDAGPSRLLPSDLTTAGKVPVAGAALSEPAAHSQLPQVTADASETGSPAGAPTLAAKTPFLVPTPAATVLPSRKSSLNLAGSVSARNIERHQGIGSSAIGPGIGRDEVSTRAGSTSKKLADAHIQRPAPVIAVKEADDASDIAELATPEKIVERATGTSAAALDPPHGGTTPHPPDESGSESVDETLRRLLEDKGSFDLDDSPYTGLHFPDTNIQQPIVAVKPLVIVDRHIVVPRLSKEPERKMSHLSMLLSQETDFLIDAPADTSPAVPPIPRISVADRLAVPLAARRKSLAKDVRTHRPPPPRKHSLDAAPQQRLSMAPMQRKLSLVDPAQAGGTSHAGRELVRQSKSELL